MSDYGNEELDELMELWLAEEPDPVDVISRHRKIDGRSGAEVAVDAIQGLSEPVTGRLPAPNRPVAGKVGGSL